MEIRDFRFREEMGMYILETSSKEPKGVFVIVHGAGEYHVRYKWTAKKLNELSYHVVIGDLPGQGLTEGPRGHVDSFSDYIQVVKKWITRAKTYQLPVILLAHSMGGLITIHLLMEQNKRYYPEVVVLSSPCLGLVNEPSTSKEILSYVLNVTMPQLRFPSNVPRGAGTRDEWMRERDLQDGKMIRKVSVRWYRELKKAMKTALHETERFPDIPLFVMQAGNDLIVDKTSVKKWFNLLDITNKYYKEFEGLYHEVLNEPEKNEVLAHMLAFVTLQRKML